MSSKSTSRTVRGQTTIEFVIMMAMALVVGSVFLFGVLNVLTDSAEQERLAALNDLGYTLQDELILASEVENGYLRNIVIPATIGRFTYTITGIQNAVILSSGTLTITYDLPEYTGAFAKGANIITKNDTISVSQ